MALQAFWYVAQWPIMVLSFHLFKMLMMEDDWFKVPAEAQRKARERREDRKGETITMLDNLYYTLDMSWYVPIVLYAIAQVCSVAGVILFVSESGVGNDLYWPVKPAILMTYVLLNVCLSDWIPWFYRKCQSRCTEQYLYLFCCFVLTCMLCVWFVLHDILAGCLLVPLALVVFVAFLFVIFSEYRCENLDRVRVTRDCKLIATASDGTTRVLIGK